MQQNFTNLVNDSNKILITGHITPDFDAYACMLFTYNIIKRNFKDKDVHMVLDTTAKFKRLAFLKGFDSIEYSNLNQKLVSLDPDLLIFVDGSTLSRFSNDPEKLETLIKDTKKVLIDHHEIRSREFDFFYNKKMSSGVEVLYQLLIKKEHLELYDNWEETFLVGLIGDNYRFYHQGIDYRKTFSVVSDILDNGYSLRKISDILFSFSKEAINMLNILFKNIHYEKNYVYSMLSEAEIIEIRNVLDPHSFKATRRYFIDNILVNINEYDLCLFLTKDYDVNRKLVYSGSFRSKPNTIDCTVLAKQLNGGGHIQGAGFELEAKSIKEALSIVDKIVDNNIKKASIYKN